jgi:hypothetical protein
MNYRKPQAQQPLRCARCNAKLCVSMSGEMPLAALCSECAWSETDSALPVLNRAQTCRMAA